MFLIVVQTATFDMALNGTADQAIAHALRKSPSRLGQHRATIMRAPVRNHRMPAAGVLNPAQHDSLTGRRVRYVPDLTRDLAHAAVKDLTAREGKR